ncbi:MAG: TadE family protein [Erythrobacter sp.]
MTISLRSYSAFARKLLRDNNALALTEFAFVAPILLLLGFAGLELANYAVVNMRLNQAAVHVADNASRIGDRDVLAAQRIFEGDINDLFIGVNLQAGTALDLYENGRVILSSLEQNSDDGQWIHWQRCKGEKNEVSAYGPQGTGETGTSFVGMGETGRELQAQSGEAVMYVEIFYTYQPIIGNAFSAEFAQPLELSAEAAFNVRGTRDLTDLFSRTPPATPSTCDIFDGV